MKNENLTNGLALVGRIFLALIFILSGWSKVTGYDGTAGYMTAMGVPFVGLLLPLTILLEVGGGIALVLGPEARRVAAAFAVFLVPVTIIFPRQRPGWRRRRSSSSCS
ncbi:MAG: DoxX family protein [Chthoniobacteraceae bacterium]